MEYVAMAIWLSLCLLLGATMHTVLRSALGYKGMVWLAAPGVAVRKFAMAVIAMLTGATVTQVNLYQTGRRDIGFNGNGPATVSKFLVPVAPLFACAVALQALNGMLGTPLSLDFSAPQIAALDSAGARGFLDGLWPLMVSLGRMLYRADWTNPALYLLFVCIFSLSLGAGVPFDRFRPAFVGVLILVTLLWLLCLLFGVRSGLGGALGSSGPAASFVRSTRDFCLSASGMALIMMLCGTLLSIAVGVSVRLFEIVTDGASGKESKSDSGEKKRAA